MNQSSVTAEPAKLALGLRFSALAVAALAVGCGPTERPPSIVLISIDTLRPDRLGCYGAKRDTSPAIDQLAAEGARFVDVVAPTSWTLPSHVTLLTGLSMPVHRVQGMTDSIDPARRLLAEHLREQGYRTAAFVSAPFLHRVYGFDRGFETYENLGAAESQDGIASDDDHDLSHRDRTAEAVVDAAIAWLNERDGHAPVFLFVHLWDPHAEYIPPAPYDTIFDSDQGGVVESWIPAGNIGPDAGLSPGDEQRIGALYDGEVRWTDVQVGRLIDAVATGDAINGSIVSLVADHGEEFFEHGGTGHARTLHEEVVRVPWILRYPSQIEAGTVLTGLASLEDVAPTLLALGGLPPLPEATGRSHSAELQGGVPQPPRPVLLQLDEAVFALRGQHRKIVRLDDGRMIYFDLSRDPGERVPRDPSRVAPRLVEALDHQLSSALEYSESLEWGDARTVELDDDMRRRLQELGYIDED